MIEITSANVTPVLRALFRTDEPQVTKLPTPAAVQVYQLTGSGRRLDEAVTALGRWGASFLGPPGTTLHHHPLWLLQSLAARTRRSSAKAKGMSRLDVDIQLDGQHHHLRFRSDRVVAGRGPHQAPQACITTSSETLYALSQRHAQIEDVIHDGRLEVRGDFDAGMRALQALVFSDPSRSEETV